MKLNTQLVWQQLITVALVLLVVAIAADSDCQDHCGDVEIPYPFGIGDDPKCYLDSRFKLKCNNSILYRGTNIAILHIDIPKGEIEVLLYVAKFCSNDTIKPHIYLNGWFNISSKANKFVTVGCDSYGILKSIDNVTNDSSSTGCLTICDSLESNIDDGTCSGRGCCQVDIPPLMNEIRLQASSFDPDYGPCSYSFVVNKESDHFRFNATYIDNLPFNATPVVLDWTIGTDNCQGVCTENSYCLYDTVSAGYRCNCSWGYQGNPYLPHGCKDIDECMISNPCKSGNKCKNTPAGSYTCFCPKWQYKTKEGKCQEILLYVLGAGAATICLFAGTFSYLRYQKKKQKKKLIKLKDEFYRENGGPELQKQLRQINIQIYTEEQLKKATKNYDESLILGRGGFGTVYKGTLEDDTNVAIKKPKKVDAGQKEEFFNEMRVLSQLNQRNLVKLLGCCLETQLLLVYEFVSNGTLSDFIKKSKSKTWETRLKIAKEVAEALSYLHKDVQIPIIHRDIKSANILMDDNDTPKIADFGSSILVPHDQNQVGTVVQGTFGYLDPEYLQTNKLTDKSDVYSFGVVLAELITGQKALSLDRTEQNLAQHFLSCIKNDSIVQIFQDGIRNDENEQEIKEVAIIASKCLRLKGAKRPSMKEVARELEGLWLKKEKHSCINADLIYLEETQYLLGEASSSTYESGDSNKLIEMVQQIGHDNLKDSPTVFEDGR